MGLFDGMFGSKHPPLPEADPAIAKIAAQNPGFESFVASANDRIEVLAGDGPLYVFVGKPPKAFGIVWFIDGERHDVRSEMESKAMTRDSAAGLVQQLGGVYSNHGGDGRFSHKVGNHAVTVTPSSAFYDEVHEAVGRAGAAAAVE